MDRLSLYVACVLLLSSSAIKMRPHNILWHEHLHSGKEILSR